MHNEAPIKVSESERKILNIVNEDGLSTTRVLWMPSLDKKYSSYYGFHFYGFINCENIQLYHNFQNNGMIIIKQTKSHVKSKWKISNFTHMFKHCHVKIMVVIMFNEWYECWGIRIKFSFHECNGPKGQGSKLNKTPPLLPPCPKVCCQIVPICSSLFMSNLSCLCICVGEMV